MEGRLMRSQWYAAIGDDGMNPVVWGVGRSLDECVADTERWLGATVAQTLAFVRIGRRDYNRVVAGDIVPPRVYGI